VQELGAAHSGLPLGVVRDVEYRQTQARLTSGQTIVTFTDGLTEAMDPEGQLYGLNRVRKQVASEMACPKSLVRRLVDDVHAYMGDRAPSDDMCLVCFGRA
jgi:sigma-B regulation protein RsbU (phosphoserine phosphatase)